MQKINLFSVHESFKADCFVNVKFIASLLLAFLLVTVSLAQADGLFDFQMKLAKGGNAEAQYKVGEMYETGFGVKQDQKEAMNWMTKSANQGHETAGFKLLYWDVEKNGLKGTNKAKVGELKKKAESGNPQAQYYVGKMNAHGVGMKKNEDEAIEWLNKAALVGVIEAESELVTVRETKQFKADRIAKEKQLKAKQEREKQAKLEQQKKLKAQQDAKAKSDAATKKKKADAAALEKASQQRSYEEKMAAKKQAEANQRKAKEKAAKNKKSAEEKNRKTQFESDPCSGKSAKFLSTCR
jgi:hypothetical protein